MNITDLKILGMYTNIDKCASKKKEIKAVAVLFVFASLCFGIGAITGKSDVTDIVVWVISILGLIGTFFMDSNCTKKIKEYEFLIYDLEVEDLNIKKRIADIKNEILPDSVINRKITAPVEDITYPVVFYITLLFFDVFIGIVLLF